MFYTFSQNNSGGSFEVTDSVAEYVVVEANDLTHAIERALAIGIYFDGVNAGLDCECCGDRWSEPYRDNGTPTPEFGIWVLDGGHVRAAYDSAFSPWTDPVAIIHFLKGAVVHVSAAAAKKAQQKPINKL